MSNTKFNPHNRSRARRYALQALYQWVIADGELFDIERQYLNDYDMAKVEVPYFQELLHEIPKHLSELDAIFQPLLDRKIAELDTIEVVALRIGTYELSKRLDIPYKVAINEAVELTKTFGTIEGYKYINAVLDKVAQKARPHRL